MRKKYLSALLFGALVFASAGTFTSCKDYDDDISNLQSQITSNAEAIKKLQELVGDGKYVTAVSNDGNTITFTFSDGTTTPITIENEGTTQVVEIKDGELWIDNKPTGIKVPEDADPEVGLVKIENGTWWVLGENGEYTNTNIPVSGVTAVKNEKNQWVLTIVDKDGKTQEIVLPTAASLISEVDVLGTVTTNENISTVAEDGVINYNVHVVTKADLNNKALQEWNKEENVKKVVEGQALSTLSSNDNNLLIRIAPANVDASDFSFTLVNSQTTEAPLTLGTPVAYDGLLTRSGNSENGLWMVPVSAKEGLTYKDVDAYKEQFDTDLTNDNKGDILFAFQEKEGFTSNYNLSFKYDNNVPLTTQVAKVNSDNVTTFPTKQDNATVQAGTNAVNVNKGEVTISFGENNAVYDAHLHFDAATIERWGIKYTEGTKFEITAQPDDVTAANFQLQVHYVTMNGQAYSEWIILHVNKSYSEVTELANKDWKILADNKKNTFDVSLDPMFTNLGSNLNKWKADVADEPTYSLQYYDKDAKEWKEAPTKEKDNMVVKLDKAANEATKFTWNLKNNKEVMQLGVQYRVVLEFKDKDGKEVLSKLIQPITFSIPSINDWLKKEQVVFNGTANGTAVMNEEDFKVIPTATNDNEESLYSLKYAFVNQLNYADGSTFTFTIDPEQKIKVNGEDKLMNKLVQVVNGNTTDAYIQLIDKKAAYNQPINMEVDAWYLGVYKYSEEEKATAAFTIKLVSPIEQGTLTAKGGENAIIEVVATEDGTAKITEGDLLAKTYANIAYKVFKNTWDNPQDTGDATGWASPYIGADPEFKSSNENVFTVGKAVPATKDAKGNITDGYVVIKPNNVAYEDAVPVTVKVTDKWGYTKEVKINVKVKPHTGK